MARPEHTPLAASRARELRGTMTISEARLWTAIRKTQGLAVLRFTNEQIAKEFREGGEHGRGLGRVHAEARNSTRVTGGVLVPGHAYPLAVGEKGAYTQIAC